MSAKIVGNFYLKKGNPPPEVLARGIAKLRQQVALRGDAESFSFKAFGCVWQFEAKPYIALEAVRKEVDPS